MPGSEEDRTVTDWRTESRFYRNKPGVGWLVAFLAIPALLALIGWGGLDRANRSDELALPSVPPSATLSVTAAAPTATATDTAVPAGGYPPWSITRSGNGLALSGALPDADTKTGLVDVLKQVMPGSLIDDKLTVEPGVTAPDAAALGGLFSAIVGIPDFDLKLDGDTVTLTGSAPAEAIKASAEEYAKKAWPNVKVVNDIEVATGATPTAPASAPASTPTPTAAPGPAPGPGAGGQCATLQADITGLLKTPITFATDGSSLAPESKRLVAQIADKVKACPDAKLSVVGHSDNTGNDAINVPLSGSRAKTVADELVSDGVAAGGVTSSGAGSANPVASNATPDGRAQNRRVEITVS